MIAVDTNILVYAHRTDSPFHRPAVERLRAIAEGVAAWAIPWPCVHEFLAIVTHPRIYVPSTPPERALDQVAAWRDSPSLSMIGETLSDHFDLLRELALRAKIAGPAFHDAKIAAICLQHGVQALWSADRDFGRYPELRVINPLIESART